MPRYAVLISPRAEAAFFAQTLKVAQAELSGVPGVDQIAHHSIGEMHFLHIDSDDPQALLRLSFAHGLFEVDGDQFRPIDSKAGFALHPDFVWGEKYRGKTNETLTQLLINLSLQLIEPKDGLRLLDPMCGRGTSLLWAMRYGISSVGIEQDPSVLPQTHRGLKKWTKLHRTKHKLSDGWVQKTNKQGTGKFLQFETETAMRLIIGDTCNAHDLTQRKPFDLLVTDVPYGVQHMGGKDARSPLETLRRAAPAWAQCLAPGGVMAIAFNANIPKRAELIDAFEGLDVMELDVSHRMSEAILRDVLLLRMPA